MKFKLVEITKTHNGHREEDHFHYEGEDGSKVSFYALREAFCYNITARDPFVGRKVVEAYTKQGFRQHEYAGGFEEAIREIEVR
jgi:hypothetical protein